MCSRFAICALDSRAPSAASTSVSRSEIRSATLGPFPWQHPWCSAVSTDDRTSPSGRRWRPLTGEDTMNTLTVRPAAELDELLTAIRGAVARNAGWRETASYVGEALREHLPSPGLLPADLLGGERGTYRSHRLHVEPDGSFSMVAIAWQPGALTRIHDHVTWCVFGILAGVEYEDLYTLFDDGAALIEVGNNPNLTGE